MGFNSAFKGLIQSRLCVSCTLHSDGLVKPIHVGAFIVNLNVKFNILTQLNCSLVGRTKDLYTLHESMA